MSKIEITGGATFLSTNHAKPLVHVHRSCKICRRVVLLNYFCQTL